MNCSKVLSKDRGMFEELAVTVTALLLFSSLPDMIETRSTSEAHKDLKRNLKRSRERGRMRVAGDDVIGVKECC
jgi:hypothetical protein